MQKYIITGATGYVGNTVVTKLLNRGEKDIKILVLPNEDISMFGDGRVEVAYGDVRDKEFLSREIPADSIVFHIAGIVDTTSKNKKMMYDVNVNGTKNIADVCLANKVKKLIYTSSVHIIVPTNKQLLVEPTEFNPDKIQGAYAKTKTIATGYVFDKVKEGLNAVVVYPAGVIGPNDEKVGNISQLMLELINNEIRAQVKGAYNFIDARDLADAIISAEVNGRVGEGYILSGNQVSVKQLFEYVGDKMGRKKRAPTIAMWFVKMFASIAEYWYKVRNKKPIFDKYSLYTLTANCNFSNKKAQDELGLKVRPARESINDCIDWLIANRPKLINLKVAKLQH